MTTNIFIRTTAPTLIQELLSIFTLGPFVSDPRYI